MLACARIGATHSVVFGGFSRRGAARPHERRRRRRSSSPPTAATAAARSCRSRRTSTRPSPRSPSVKDVVVVRRTGEQVAMHAGRDHWWHELMDAASPDCPAEPLDARASALHPLHQRHDREAEGRRPHDRRLPAARHVQLAQWVFDLKDEDTFWCTADIGWVTGHSYVVYGIARERRDVGHVRGRAEPARSPDRFWEIIDDATASRSSTPRRRRSAPSSSGARSGRASTTSRRCACSARSASRSIPKRGCGTTA